jgi:hypothetical protein
MGDSVVVVDAFVRTIGDSFVVVDAFVRTIGDTFDVDAFVWTNIS